MKRNFLLCILIASMLSAKAQQITLLEYFYDTDPGIGNGRTLTLNTNNLDSTLPFSLSGLTPGMHRVGFRLKNSNNKWGSTTWSSFNLFAGTAGTPQINKAEYFWNNDAGVGQNTIIPVGLSPLVDTTFTLPYPTGGTGTKWLGMRLHNQNGYVGNTAYDSASVCLLSSARAGFYITQSGNTFSCTDTSTSFTSSRNVKWYVNGTQIQTVNNSYVYNINTDNWTPGSYAIKQVVGEGCQLDSVTKSISVTGFSKISPSYADSTSNITIYIAGGGFDSTNLMVQMVPVSDGNRPFLNGGQTVNGEPAINAISKKVYGNRSFIEVKFKVPAAQMPADTERKLYGIRLINSGRNLSPGTINGNVYSPEAVFCIYGKKYWVDNRDRHYSYLDNTGAVTRFVSPSYYHKWADLPDQPFYVDKKTSSRNGGSGGLSAVAININGPVRGRLGESFTRTIEITNNGNEAINDLPVHVVLPYNKVQTTFTSAVQWWNDPRMNSYCNGTAANSRCDYPQGFARHQDAESGGASNDPGASESSFPDDDYPDPVSYIDRNDGTIRNHVRQNIKKYPAQDRMPDGTLFLNDRFEDDAFIIPRIPPGQTAKIPVKIKPQPRKPGDFKRPVPIQATVGEPISTPNQTPSDYLTISDCYSLYLSQIANYNDLRPDFERAQQEFIEARIAVEQGYQYELTEDWMLHWLTSQFLIQGVSGSSTGAIIDLDKKSKAIAARWSEAQSRWRDVLKLKKASFDEFRKRCGNNKDVLPPQAFSTFEGENSFDPNNIIGNSQYDTVKHWINNKAPQHYTINFENLPAATANAQHVYIIDTLNKYDFDLKTLTLSSFTIGDSVYRLPKFLDQSNKLVKLKGRNNMQVNFSAKMDTATGVLRFDFYSMSADGSKTIDPLSLDGFLPPNTDGTKGTGSVSFDIYTRYFGTDSTFTNRAIIYFDKNAPILTNTWRNTVDTTAPTGFIQTKVIINDSTIGLVINKTDKGSGYAKTKLYGKTVTDTVFYSMGTVYGDTLIVNGRPGEQWQYYMEAIDNVGNTMAKSPKAEMSHTFGSAANTTLFIIYPVPAQQYFKIKTDKVLKDIQVYDMQGRLMKSTGVSPTNLYSTNGLANGVYVVRAITDNGDVITKKFMVLQ